MGNLILLVVLLVFSSSSLSFQVLASSSFSKVKTLPGFQGPLPFQLETGYIGVDEADDVQFFYYFIESERNPKEDPVIIWFTGGPGCSDLSALLYEIGPITFKPLEKDGSMPPLVLNPYSWTKVCNIIFLDSPAGTGFSYSRSTEGWQTGASISVDQAYSFILKWLEDHLEFQKNPFYVAGDSFSGAIIPLIVEEIVNGIESQQKPAINLKGYLQGNALTDGNYDYNARIPYAHRMALVSDELFQLTKQSCNGNYVTVGSRNAECANNLAAVSKCTKWVNQEYILDRKCEFASPKPNGIKEIRRSLEEDFENIILEAKLPEYGCRAYNYLPAYSWANNESVRNALHIRKGTIGAWKSGDHDMNIPYIGTLAWIKSLNLSITDDWRPWFLDAQVAGYTRTYNKLLTFATVKGAGHTAPEFKPQECLAMIDRWFSDTPL
ncbi:Serine carboxypeptidase-like [Thalictrum thalictroides]|uniref:Serine carboxypeptidase-like n=1 Tax=Thalictrum thalictroides TaxID=46969 RepID=A0A7J6UVN1_THATH|nr:Serine carboxypeptidase-like [Thalictrum thalictroides]